MSNTQEGKTNVPQEVILDLLPVYLSGEASPATRALVEDYMKQDPKVAKLVGEREGNGFAKAAVPPSLPPDLESKTLRRTRRILTLQRWLFGFGIGFIGTAISYRFSYRDGYFKGRFLMLDYPLSSGIMLLIGAACWIGYLILRRRVRTGAR